MENYREKFKKYYKIEFTADYDIHHIDLIHGNNTISNLMILPKELHNKYHSLLNEPNITKKYHRSFMILPTGYQSNFENTNLLLCMQLIEVIQEMNKWVDYKKYLDGLIPNIHNLEVIL